MCGALMLNATCTKVLMVRGWGINVWSFPKGKINENEVLVDCAIREVEEETGYGRLCCCRNPRLVFQFRVAAAPLRPSTHCARAGGAGTTSLHLPIRPPSSKSCRRKSP